MYDYSHNMYIYNQNDLGSNGKEMFELSFELFGYGQNYNYAHDFEGNFALQEFMPDELTSTLIYRPSKNKREDGLRLYLKDLWKEKYDF